MLRSTEHSPIGLPIMSSTSPHFPTERLVHLTAMLALTATLAAVGCNSPDPGPSTDTAQNDVGTQEDTSDIGIDSDGESSDAIGGSDVTEETDGGEPEPNCTTVDTKRECLRHFRCNWTGGACEALASPGSSDRAQPLELNASGTARPLVEVGFGDDAWSFDATRAFISHTNSSVAGYLRMAFDGPDGDSVGVVHRFRGSVAGDGTVDWTISGGRCTGGQAPWCSDVASCADSTDFPYRASGRFDGRRLVVDRPSVASSADESACSSAGFNDGWVMIHDGFRPMTPDRPTFEGGQPSTQSLTIFSGTAALAPPASTEFDVRDCSVQLVVTPAPDSRWELQSFSCNDGDGNADVVDGSFDFTEDGRLWFVVERTGSDVDVQRRLYVGVVGQLGDSSKWRLTGRVADDTGRAYTGDAQTPIAPSAVDAADRLGTFTLHWSR